MTILILLILAIIFAVLWFRERGRADVAEAQVREYRDKATLYAIKANNLREALETSYVGLQALAEKNLELEWIRKEPGNVVQPGVWVGDDFIEVDMAEGDEIEVGQPVGETNTVPTDFPQRPYSWKAEMP